MARENQGLQIALIVFVMLTIILGVTTFIFFRQYEEADAKAKAHQKEATDNLNGMRLRVAEIEDLKAKMGFAPNEEKTTLDAEFAKDMATYAANFPAETQVYRQVLARLYEVIKEKNDKLAELQAEVQDLKNRYQVREASKDPQIQQAEQAAARAATDLAEERNRFNQDRQRITADQAQIAAQLDKARKEATAAMAKVEAKMNEMGTKLQQMVQLNKQKSEQIRDLVKESFDTADGEVRWVNQRQGTVWISVGRADGLTRQVTFSVYPADVSNLTKAGRKASVEVTQILGDHLAEARVLDDDVSDPIVPGDKIHSPVWTPGEPKRFALAGFIDIDGDGKSDQQLVHDLILLNGGIVDCQPNDKGNERIGQLTAATRYLVLGEAPDARGEAGVIETYSRTIGEADQLGTEKITVGELLQRMGWKQQAGAVRFGQGANPDDFRPRPPEGVPRTSSGNVSDIFRPRTPPRSGGAY